MPEFGQSSGSADRAAWPLAQIAQKSEKPDRRSDAAADERRRTTDAPWRPGDSERFRARASECRRLAASASDAYWRDMLLNLARDLEDEAGRIGR